MVISNSSSSSITSSTMSSESAPMSSWNDVLRVTCSLFTPRLSHTIWMMRSSVVATRSPPKAARKHLKSEHRRPRSRPGSQQPNRNQTMLLQGFMYHTDGNGGKGYLLASLPAIRQFPPKTETIWRKRANEKRTSVFRRDLFFARLIELSRCQHDQEDRAADHGDETNQDTQDRPHVAGDGAIRRLVLVR